MANDRLVLAPKNDLTRREFIKKTVLVTGFLGLVGIKRLSSPNRVNAQGPDIYDAAKKRAAEWAKIWPDSADKVAQQLGGTASQWSRNDEWPDSRTVPDAHYQVTGYINREWRPVDANNVPFKWPKNAAEALQHFFPGQSINPKFIQEAWKDSKTQLVTGWHLSEDHWLVDGSPPDVQANIHIGEVAEGYTVNGTLDPKDDRNWVVFGGVLRPGQSNTEGPIQISQIRMQKGQGMTIWMPGTDPNAIALRMEPFSAGDTPHYSGPNGEQLGPDAYEFPAVYPAANLISR